MSIEPVASFDTIRAEWAALAEAAGGCFGTPEWLEAWWSHFGEERTLLLHACRSPSGELTALLPLYRWRERPRVIRFLGHGPGDELGPVVAPGRSATAADALRQVLAGLEWDVFLGEQLPGEDDWPQRLGMPLWREEASPRLTTPDGGWESYLRERSPNFRQQLARRQRTLDAAGSPVFRLADERSLEHDLDTLFALHRARWGFSRTGFEDTPFHREASSTALGQGRLRLWILELDGRPIAAWHGFKVGHVTSYYQAGRDPAVGHLSPGTVLLAHTVRTAMSEGTREYRFGRGGEPFKYRLTDDDPQVVSVASARTLVGRAALTVARAMRGWHR